MSCCWLKAEDVDSISLIFHWKGVLIHEREGGRSFSTIGFENAVYLPDFNYLPGIEIKEISGRIEDLEVTGWAGDTLDPAEQRIFHQLHRKNFQSFQIKTYSKDGHEYSDVLFFPFRYDEKTKRLYKLSSARIRYTRLEKSKERSSSTSKRTASEGTSIFESGDWYKIAVAENGVYKIDRGFLEGMGINSGSVDPRKIKIYGNGGGMLAQKIEADRPEDPIENAIFVLGENDGRFDNGDYILFYGQSPHKIGLDTASGNIWYDHNFYSDTTYYFLTTSGANGERITSRESLGDDFPSVSSYNELYFHEQDQTNILSSGREWYGERFDATLSRNFEFDLDGAVPGSELSVTAAVLGQSLATSSMDISVNNEKIGEINLFPIPDDVYSTKGIEEKMTFTYKVKQQESANFVVNLKFNKASGVKSSSYLNYLLVSGECSLKFRNQLIFRSLKSVEDGLSSSTFLLSEANSQVKIWDISSPLSPVDQEFTLEGDVASFGTETEALKEFIAFQPPSLPSPTFVKAIANQNLKGEPVPDLIIVSHADFLSEANRLAAHRRFYNNLDVLVTTPEHIYNEFSSGAQDATAIRNLAKFFYEKGNQTKLKNILLFGKCSFDYKNREPRNTNFVPTYSSRNSTNPVSSYSSDDYYTLLENGEGEWFESYAGDQTLDIGVGRLPVTTREEARIIVDKLIHYDKNPSSFGEWRNQLTFLADDGDNHLHEGDAEDLTIFIDTTYARFNIKKIYVDAFPQIKSASGESAPGANDALNKSISKGSLLVNFTGHGSETRWCSETVLDINTIKKWTNWDKLPVFVTATCEFGRHDDPSVTSGAEYLLLSPVGGAIGLVTTSRPVYANTNYDINKAFYESVFERDEDGFYDLGTIFRNTKNRSLKGSNNRNFSLLGDPSMKLALAENNIEIIASAEDFKSPGDTLKALELISLKGKIVDWGGATLAGFDGQLTATIYDKSKKVQTLGNEGSPFIYSERNNIIFRGDAHISNGEFSFKFIVPKNISYQIDRGKINFYAQSGNLSKDAAGSDLTFQIGGSGSYVTDSFPPEIDLFINDTSFVEKSIAGEDIITLARIFDENGINLLNDELNQGVVIKIDDENFTYAGDFFKNDANDYQTGWLRYPYFDLEEGHHKLTIGAYDTHNNYSENEIDFYVSNSERFVAENLFNYPNPLTDHTTFSFDHNRAGEDLEIYLEIYDLQGKKVYVQKQVTFSSPGRIETVEWAGETSTGKKLEPGLYVYIFSVRSLKDSSNIRISNKLLIIN